jgi:uncharacterized protein YlaI
MTERLCPRCERRPFETDEEGALSRTTRDDGAEILVCSECGSREALYGREPEEQPHFTEWPLSRERIEKEDELRRRLG